MPIVSAYAALSKKATLTPFSYESAPLGPHDVDVRVTHCGICHSDLAMIDNDWHMTAYPLVPGHEVAGLVAAVGADVTSVKVGDRVGVGWQCGSCTACEYCLRGRENFCAKSCSTIVRHHGGWASQVRTQEHFAIPLPDAIDAADAAPLMCAGTTVFAPMLHYNVKPTMRVAVIGVGGLGHLAVQYLAKFGCEVTAISSTGSKSDEARQLGAKHVRATRDPDALKKAKRSFDFIMSTVSASLDWNAVIAMLRPEGTLCLPGIPDADLKFGAFGIISGEKRVVGGGAGSPSDTAEMLAFTVRHGIKPMIEQFKMADVNAAVTHVREGKARYRVVLSA
jgi:alcohol/geraniol dehydrogenase (NADP+)